ncbi:MAG TPA: response regulator [Thermoanaerobaculia bacterium]|nr:response regulator [Thermoanaerobaculia bacterium]
MSTRKRLALVIDDDEAMRDLIQVLLESRDFEVESAADGIHATELTRDYDVIVLDMKMPVFDGAKLADYWKLTVPHVLRRVVVLSGYSRVREPHPDAFAVISKPFNHDEFIKTIEECANQ